MAAHGDDPVGKTHYDAETLTAYALDQLPRQQAEAVRAHLLVCPACRDAAAETARFTHAIDRELHDLLDRARPASNLSFDTIAREWRKPPHRVSLRARLARLTTGFASAPLILLLALAITILAPYEDSLARRNLELTDTYTGPPALVAVAFDEGVAIVRLDGEHTGVVRHFRRLGDLSDLSFAPDGRWLAFQRGSTLHLVETSADGQHAKLDLTENAEWAWSPDSAALAYTDGHGRLVVFDLALQTHNVLVPASERAWGPPLWSLDGTQIAYALAPQATANAGNATQGIWRVDPATGYRVELARNPAPETSLLVPAAWLDGNTLILARDGRMVNGDQAEIYRIQVNARQAQPLEAVALARGDQLSWPVSPDGHMLALRGDRLVTLNVVSERARAVPDHLRAPAATAWAPGGAWLAAIVPGKPGGEGLYLYAPGKAKVVQVRLPAGAAEKSVAWAGSEHLFVVRQPDGATYLELWLVSTTGAHAPQRLLSNITLPESGGWLAHDTVATRAISLTSTP